MKALNQQVKAEQKALENLSEAMEQMTHNYTSDAFKKAFKELQLMIEEEWMNMQYVAEAGDNPFDQEQPQVERHQMKGGC